MILQAANAVYERLLKDPEQDVPRPGFSRQKIHYELLLNQDGNLVVIHNIQVPQGKKLAPKEVFVPEPVKRTSGVASNFLWDNTGYVLGADAKGKPDRVREQFEAFTARAHEIGGDVDDPGMAAVLAFLDAWDPGKASELPGWEDMAGLNIVFRLDGEAGYVHDRPAVREAWLCHTQQACSSYQGLCLVTGQRGPIARLHPAIKGVRGAQSSGAALVSFNLDAFSSYGKEQNFNAPVGEQAAFAYTTALNHLLAKDSKQKVQVGDATVVFWSEKKTRMEGFMAAIMGGQQVESAEAQDAGLVTRLHDWLEVIRQGGMPTDLTNEAATPFYILGLSPNAARISVRFWLVSTVGQVAERVGRHFADLRIERQYEKQPEFPGIWQLLLELAPQHKSENVPPLLGGQLLRAILTGSAYPQSLLARLIGRLRAEQEVSYLKAALLKACLKRNNLLPKDKEAFVALDPKCENIGYLLGRLFAVLEKAQQDALPGINATIKDRFFGAASATPRSVFPRLIKLAQHHISKADYGFVADRLLAKVSEKIDACTVGFPAHLSLENQGLFALGYYHQRNDNYRKNEEKIDPIKESN